MKFAIRALVLGIAVSGLAASALTAHMGNTSAMANSRVTAIVNQPVMGAMPVPICYPNCGIQNGMHR